MLYSRVYRVSIVFVVCLSSRRPARCVGSVWQPLLCCMNVREAQGTRVVAHRRLLSTEECEAIVVLAKELEQTNSETTLRFCDDMQLSQRGNWKTVCVVPHFL